MANSISTVGDITASGEEGDTDICDGDVLSYGQPGVPTPGVWATPTTMHQLRYMQPDTPPSLPPFLVEQMARYHASALFRSSVAAGLPATFRVCVQQVNEEFAAMPGRLTLENTTIFCYGDASAPLSISKPTQTYMYFQMMKNTNHSLALRSDAKRRAHLPRNDISKILCEVSVLGETRYTHAQTDLAITPHGSEMTSAKNAVDGILERAGVPQVTVIHGGKRGVVDLSKSLGLVVLYSNSAHLKCIPNHLELEQQLMQHFISHCLDELDVARSSGLSGARLVRKWWGFTQNMPVKYKINRQFNVKTRRVIVNRGKHMPNGLVIPSFSTKMFHIMPPYLKSYLFCLMETGQTVVRKHWAGRALNC